MCHNAPWLSALDKQMRLQFAPKQSKADVMSQFWRQSIPYSGSSSRGNSVAETVMGPWNDTGSVTGRSQPTSSSVSDKLNVVRQVLRSLPRQRLVHQTVEFKVDSLAHWKPVQLAQDQRSTGNNERCILQGSVATVLRCGENFTHALLASSSSFQK